MGTGARTSFPALTPLSRIVRQLAIAVLVLYRVTLSPDHGLLRVFFPGGVCRFSPSCSLYMEDAIRTRGFLNGVLLGVRRILRCHPWSPGGYDPVPDSTS